ncbi:MAG: glycosyltransferase, partial [Candidatus Hydrogenedentes bacterium]|nr:glycosyltransferase [Candidatus Hydrogenedentota bacterium]
CKDYPVTLLVQKENCGPARCRNLGAAAAAGDVLLFLDADIYFSPDLLPRMIALLESNEHFAGVLSLTSPDPLNIGFAARFVALQDYLRYAALYDDGHRSWSYITTRFGLLKRAVFEETGGFNENLRRAAYEDLEFCARLDERHQLALDKDFLIRHYFPSTLWKMMKRLHINARGILSFSQAMRRKVSAPFIRDRNARVLLGISWICVAGGLFFRPLWMMALFFQLGAAQQIGWLPRGFYREEGLLFALKGWVTYNMTLLPFATGVLCGLLNGIRNTNRKKG